VKILDGVLSRGANITKLRYKEEDSLLVSSIRVCLIDRTELFSSESRAFDYLTVRIVLKLGSSNLCYFYLTTSYLII
jgi:hypothetical protein